MDNSIDINNNFKVKTVPYKHQITACERAYMKKFFALFMEQGTGKTKVSIDLASNMFLNDKIDAVLLVAPNGVQSQWYSEQIPEHSPIPTDRFLWKTSSTLGYKRILDKFTKPNTVSKQLKWFCVNIETFSSKRHIQLFRDFCLNNRTLVIVDEATRIKNPEAERTYNLTYGINHVVYLRKLIKEFRYTSCYRLILTGMMITNSPFDLYSLFTFLQYDFWKMNWFAFKARYGILVKDVNKEVNKTFMRAIRPDEIESIRKQYAEGVSTIELSCKFNISESNVQHILTNQESLSGFKNLEELKQKIAEHCYIVTKDECLDLPKKVFEKVYVEMSAEQKRVYKELEKDLLTRYSGKELSVKNKMVLVGRLQQITGGFFPYQDIYINEDGDEIRLKKESKALMISNSIPKLTAILSDIEESGNEQLIIWCRFIAEIKAIRDYFRTKLPHITVGAYFGGVTRTERGFIIDEFKAKKLRVLIANPRTAGIGLNLQVAHLCYYYSNDFSLENRKQSEDRIHRIPQTSVCVYKDIICKDTIDEKVHEVLEAKNNLLNYFRSTSLVDILKKEASKE